MAIWGAVPCCELGNEVEQCGSMTMEGRHVSESHMGFSVPTSQQSLAGQSPAGTEGKTWAHIQGKEDCGVQWLLR